MQKIFDLAFKIIKYFWPLIVWVIARDTAGELALGTTFYRAAFPVASAAVGLGGMLLGAGGFISRSTVLVFMLLAMLGGVLGVWAEFDRWAPFLGNQGYTLWFILLNLDYTLILTSFIAIFLPALPAVAAMKVSIPSWAAKTPTSRGSARWLSLHEATQVLSRGELIVGEAYDAQSRKPEPGSAPLLKFDGKEHLLTVGGAGTGKSTAIAIPNCLTWTGSLVVLDPKGELAQTCRVAREAMGHDVLVLEPGNPLSDAVNILEWLDPATDKVVSQADAVVTWLTGAEDTAGKDAVFTDAAKELLQATILDVVCDADIPVAEKTLQEVYRRLSGDVEAYLIALEKRPAGFAYGIPQAIGVRFISMSVHAPPTWQGVYAHAMRPLGWLKVPSLARLVSGQGAKVRAISDILNGKLDVFLSIPLSILDASPQVARALLGALLYVKYSEFELTKKEGKRVLFLLDEMPRLKRMEIIQTARDAGRGLGVTLWAIVQDLGQLDQCYGQDGARGWIESTRIRTFLGVSHPLTAQFLADCLGQETKEEESSSSNSGRSGSFGDLWGQRSMGRSVTRNYIGRPLMTPDEIMRMQTAADGSAEEQIILMRGQYPLRCGVAKFWRRHDLPYRNLTK